MKDSQMPLIHEFKGIKVYIYSREHRPPHIHVVYGEYEVLLSIETVEVYAGYIPGKQKKLAINWISENSDQALRIFYELNRDLK